MSTGVSDIATDRAADDGGDGGEINHVRQDGLAQSLAQRRVRGKGGEENQADLQGAQHHHDAIHRNTRTVRREDRNGDQRTQGAPPFGVKTGQRIQAQARTGDVAQTEHQAAEDDQYREQITTARDRCVGQVGRAHSGQRHDAPDIQLHHEVDQDRRQNAEGKRRPQGRGERGCLGQKSWADGRGRHHEDRGDQ